jgi:hypothetical protein
MREPTSHDQFAESWSPARSGIDAKPDERTERELAEQSAAESNAPPAMLAQIRRFDRQTEYDY